jgi:hypothetical protein
MRIVMKPLVQIFDDLAKKNALFAPNELLSELVIDGYDECSSGRFRLSVGGTFAVPFGTVASRVGFLIVCFGEPGVDLSVNGLAARNLRPASAGVTDTQVTPRCHALEESTNISSLQLTHPIPSGAGEDITGWYAVWGDAPP